jgi:DGQHR domain-containing protein
MGMKKGRELRLPAIEVLQGNEQRLYSFAVDGKVLSSFATVSRIRRQDGGAIEGYQRPEALAHINGIKQYIESGSPMIPNAVVLAFDPRVTFEPSNLESGTAYSRVGTLVIPIDEQSDDESKPGFIVDGQQRLAAIRDAKVESFPVCVTAFITSDIRKQVEQFILVNSTKPLPKGLIYELLPNTDALLPTLLHRRRFPAALLERLNFDDDSPLKGLVQTATNPGGIVKDNSLLKMLENSLSDGLLYRLRSPQGEAVELEAMLQVVKVFWQAVKAVFPDAWGQPPKRSRLMHGAGIVSMGYLMETIGERHRDTGLPTYDQFVSDLVPLRDVCRWTDGIWDFGPGNQRKWNTVQNTHSDIQTLSSYLYYQYKARVWNSSTSPRAAASLGLQARS